MSKKFKSQASSSRAASSTFGAPSFGFGAPSSGFQTNTSPLSHVTEFPDLSGVTDPKAKVALKNLTKKDSVTKTKALEDLLEFLSADAASLTEWQFLEAWAEIYPRTSIDNGRRVRQLSHTLQGSLTVQSGKRIAPLLPKVVGAWLSGTFESDKAVSRAALESLEAAFPSETKRVALWKVYQKPLLDHLEDAILHHSPQTLSDERTTSPDDAEAKHARVLSTAISALDRLVQIDSADNSLSATDSFQSLIQAPTLYEHVVNSDSSVRRAVYKFLAHLASNGVHLDWPVLSRFLLAKALITKFENSSTDYISTLLAVTKARPSIWTTEYTSKPPVLRQLYIYIKRGSQRGLDSWWPRLRLLITLLPPEIWGAATTVSDAKPSNEMATELLGALHDGLRNGDEPRQNLVSAWQAYLDIFFWILSQELTEESRDELTKSFLHPLIQRYLQKSPDLSRWALPSSAALNICASSVLGVVNSNLPGAFDSFYKDQLDTLVTLMRTPPSEPSKTFREKQDEIVSTASRFIDLQIACENGSPPATSHSSGIGSFPQSLITMFLESNMDLLQAAVGVLRDQKGISYGAAGVIYNLLSKVPDTLRNPDAPGMPNSLAGLLEKEAPTLLETPSGELLISTMLQSRSIWNIDTSFDLIVLQFVEQKTLRKTRAYTAFVRGLYKQDISRSDVRQMILDDLQAALSGDETRWVIVHEVLTNRNERRQDEISVKSSEFSVQNIMLEDMISGLATENFEDQALKGFDFLVSRDRSLRSLLPFNVNIAKLLTHLILISDSQDEERAEKAARVATSVKKFYAQQGDEDTSLSTVGVITQQLEGEGALLPIVSLIEVARDAIEKSEDDKSNSTLVATMPNSEQWDKALTQFLQLPPPLGSSLIMSLGGCTFLVDRPRRKSAGGLIRDRDSFSIALRLTIYATKILENVSLHQLTTSQREALFLYYPQALQLINDKLSNESANALWIDNSEDLVRDISEIAILGRNLVNSWARGKEKQEGSSNGQSIASFWLSQLPNITGSSAQAFNLARSLVDVMNEAYSQRGLSKERASWESPLQAVRSSPDVMRSAATLVICREDLAATSRGARMCNELVAFATDVNFENSQDAIRRLALLNLLLLEEGFLETVPSQRLIFLTKRLLTIPRFDEAPSGLQSELFKTLTSIAPPMNELYGEFWQDMVNLLQKYLTDLKHVAEYSPLHSALKLYACLSSMVARESNEDLEEALSGAQNYIKAALLDILNLFDEAPSGANQPIAITAAFLARQVRDSTFNNSQDVSETYHLLASEDKNVQEAAYGILHRSLPKIQEELSIEAALSKKLPHLPEELFSLLLDQPPLERVETRFHSADAIWINIRRYLLTWKVLFDHFSNASHVVRGSYVADIKSHGHLDYLLHFCCELLRIASGKPIDASKSDNTNFQLDVESSLEKEIQWLTTNLYFLCLLHLPSLTKTWWIEQKNRIKMPLETWSQKYICPLVISASLDTVSTWHADNKDDSEDQPLSVKINYRSAELVAAIPIDPDSPPISLCITLPPTYPLALALVTSRARVIVSEQKWQSWLRTIQGIINFPGTSTTTSTSTTADPSATSSSGSGSGSSGGLIDGLLAFRRNVQGALKGQTECAICYSVIGTEMKVADKKCGTCKNVFHGGCLYRWFRSSNSSSCPLCRNPFHYA